MMKKLFSLTGIYFIGLSFASLGTFFMAESVGAGILMFGIGTILYAIFTRLGQ